MTNLNSLYRFFCPECHIAACYSKKVFDKKSEVWYNKIIRCNFCGYEAPFEEHMQTIKKKLREAENENVDD